MRPPLKIAIIADPEIPVPPTHYGGIERIVHSLIKELQDSGHSVSLFAHPDSSPGADHFYPYNSGKQNTTGIFSNALNISRLLLNRPDVVHSFGRLAYLSALMPTRLPKIMSYQREPTLAQIKKAVRLSARDSMHFTGCSDYITNQIIPFANATTVFNFVSLQDYDFSDANSASGPLVFLGRIEPIKGTHHAIYVAKQTGKQLIIAGNIPPYARAYYEEEIAPFIDGIQIQYVGTVNDRQKNAILGKACALLMPIEWNEPFGIVMAESLACGTPVLALKGGATYEVVRDGFNGFLCDNRDDLVGAVRLLNEIDRKNCRKDAENRFSSVIVSGQYEKLYYNILDQKNGS